MINPYLPLKNDKHAQIRINADASRDDVMLIKSVFPDGEIQTIINLYIQSLAHECRTNNWNITNRNDLLASIERRCSTSVSSRKTPRRNV